MGFYRERRVYPFQSQDQVRIVVGGHLQVGKVLALAEETEGIRVPEIMVIVVHHQILVPKTIPGEVNNFGLGFPTKTKKQKALEKMKRELKESIQEQDKINKKTRRKNRITLIIKNDTRFFVANSKLRDKYHHVLEFDTPLPETLTKAEIRRLADPSLYDERLKIFRNRKILPDVYVEKYGQSLRSHVLDVNTEVIEGTFGGNREAREGMPKTEGYHLYNSRTGFNAFFDKNTRRYKTGFQLNERQVNDLKTNKNVT